MNVTALRALTKEDLESLTMRTTLYPNQVDAIRAIREGMSVTKADKAFCNGLGLAGYALRNFDNPKFLVDL